MFCRLCGGNLLTTEITGFEITIHYICENCGGTAEYTAPYLATRTETGLFVVEKVTL